MKKYLHGLHDKKKEKLLHDFNRKILCVWERLPLIFNCNFK